MLINGCTEKERVKLLANLGAKDQWHNITWPLPNAKKITENEFWGWRASYTFRGEVWADQHKIGDEWATLLIYHVDHSHYIGGGFAVLVFRRYRQERVEYYEWRNCDHAFTEKNAGHCLHRYTCSKCNASYDIDSSG